MCPDVGSLQPYLSCVMIASKREIGPTHLVDTHAHLQWPSLIEENAVVVGRAREEGLCRILTLGTDLSSSRQALEIAEAHEDVYAAVGIHPSEVTADPTDLETIATFLDHPRVVAVGETGLDYYHEDNPPRIDQIRSFKAHLELAAASGKPVSIHSRESIEDVLLLLEPFMGGLTAILHCFSGDLTIARQAVQLGCYLSFAGNITYPRAHDLLDVAAHVPIDRLLLETDSPFLAPQPVRGRKNEPSYIAFVYVALAQAKGVETRVVAEAVRANAAQIFGWEAA